MSGLFITASGTDCGKTYLLTQLLRWDLAQQKCLTFSKPIITGWPSDEGIQHTDTGLLLQAQQRSLTARNLASASPWRFAAPLTPQMAATKIGKTIDFKALLRHGQMRISQAQRQKKIHLIEGVGGVMSPLTSSFTVLEWITGLGCAALVVTGSYLGSLSHTLTTIAVLKNKGIPIVALIVNETPHSSVTLAESCQCLMSHLPELKVIPLSHQPSARTLSQVVAKVYKVILQYQI